MSRRIARETLFKAVFQLCTNGHDDFAHNKLKELGIHEKQLDEQDVDYFSSAYAGIVERLDELNQKIAQLSSGFELDRIYKTDLAILLVAMYEIHYIDDIPPLVSVNEAVELAKLYSTQKSFSFINGILASALKEEI